MEGRALGKSAGRGVSAIESRVAQKLFSEIYTRYNPLFPGQTLK